MVTTRNTFLLALVILFGIFALPRLSSVKPLAENTYVLRGDWHAISATVTYSVDTFRPKPIFVEDEHWETKVIAKPGQLITLTVTPHSPSKSFKTNCFILNRYRTIVGEDHAAWDENNGKVLCSVMAN